jgi:hypothetical protein
MSEKKGGSPAIEVVDAMRLAWESGVTGYTPHFRGETLEEECGDPRVSLANLRKIVAGSEKVWAMYGRRESVLVCFSGGLSYLATGFGAGQGADRPRLLALAKFAAEVGLGSAEKILRHFGAFPDDYEGELEFPVPGDLSLVK